MKVKCRLMRFYSTYRTIGVTVVLEFLEKFICENLGKWNRFLNNSWQIISLESFLWSIFECLKNQQISDNVVLL